MTGEMKDYVALEVVPFSVFIRLSGDELVELIKKDSTIPTSSENYSFNIPEGRKSRFVEVQLMMKDGSLLKNLNKWKIKTDYRETFILQVDTGTDLNISVRAFSKSHGELQVQEVST
jgi:molecular chaperone DnaK (HSP70)